MRISLALASLCVIAAGCGGASPAPRARTTPAAVTPAPVVVAEGAVIRRAALDEALEGGPGRFLQRVTVEPDLREGRFVGYRITDLVDAELFGGVDLAPGDTIVEVNGTAIERPEHAFTVWSSLRVASELTLSVLRGTERRELRFAIVD